MISEVNNQGVKMKKLLLSALIATSLTGFASAKTGDLKVAISGFAVHTGEEDMKVTNVPSNHVIDYKWGWGVGTAIGYNFTDDLSAEAEISYRINDVDKLDGVTSNTNGETSATAFMVNGYYKIKNNVKLVPYIGGGLGVARVTLDDITTDESDTVLAWQGMAGLEYVVSEKMSAKLGYRYFDTTDAKVDTSSQTIETGFSNHNIELGVIYRLGNY